MKNEYSANAALSATFEIDDKDRLLNERKAERPESISFTKTFGDPEDSTTWEVL